MAIWKDTDQLNVYIDESGTVSLTDPNMWYIAVGIILPAQQVSELSAGLELIAKKYFSGGIIKSSNVGNNNERREQILQEICKFDFQFVFLFIDKTKIRTDSGYRFKKPFYKNLNSKLYNKLCRCGGYAISLVCKTDQYGDHDFQQEAKKYFEEKQDLLSNFSINYADDKSDRILQLADFIAGTLVFCWVPAKWDDKYSPTFRNLVKDHVMAYETFPRSQREVRQVSDTATDEEINSEIEKVLYNRALSFIEKYKDEDDEFTQRQVATLNLLLEDYEFDGSRGNYFFLDEIQDRLFDQGFEKLQRQQFISKVIGHLRYKGIIISGSNRGYCLALSLNDIKDYLDHNATIIFPMLDRIKEARSAVKMAMNYDILKIISLGNDFEALLDAKMSSELTSRETTFDEEKAITNIQR